MKAQLDLFAAPKPIRKRRDERRIIAQAISRAAIKGGLVNGMSKAALRRYAPAKLPRVTIND